MDSRINEVLTNSRFKQPKSSKTRVKVDARFRGMFTDSNFISKDRVEKRGKFLKPRTDVNTIYELDGVAGAQTPDQCLEEGGLESERPIPATPDDINHDVDIYDENSNVNYSDDIISSRLAITNVDWQKVDAKDIFVILAAFCDSEELVSVNVYPSEFGLKELRTEELDGPSIEDSADNNNDDKLSAVTLKKYYLRRARFYYAIASFISDDVADKVYQRADGLEVEFSSLVLSLSFVPPETEFGEPTSSCTSLPSDYQPHNFIISELQQTDANLNWDETDSRRLEVTLKKKFTQEDLEDPDKFDSFLAPPSDEEAENVCRSKYMTLIEQEKESSDEESMSQGSSGNSSQSDEEKLFEESVVQDAGVRDDLHDPFLTKRPSYKTQRQHQKARPPTSIPSSTSAAEYELLTLDVNRPQDASDTEAKPPTKANPIRKDFKKKLKHSSKSGAEKDNFAVDVDDKRFSAMFTSPHFALDPSSALFKTSDNMKKLLTEQTSRRHKRKYLKEDKSNIQ